LQITSLLRKLQEGYDIRGLGVTAVLYLFMFIIDFFETEEAIKKKITRKFGDPAE
jgi:hypothetical protein